MDKSSNAHLNYMNGISYFPDNPINRLMMVGCSFFLGEKGYYNPSTNKDTQVENSEKLKPYLLFAHHGNKSKQQVFFETVNLALDYDFEAVLKAAKMMRHDFLMRKSPMAIFAIAAGHVNRVDFNEKNPGLFRKYIVETSILPGDMVAILDAWKNHTGSKSKFPSFIKRAMSDRLSQVSKYQANKYRKSCIDCARLSHPKSTPLLSELMKTGKLEMEESSIKWETLRSMGYSWLETLEALQWKMPHMAALRNLRGFALAVRNEEMISKYCQMLVEGVQKGKQFPFRYYTAYQQIKKYGDAGVSVRTRGRKRIYKKVKLDQKIREEDEIIILDCLEECIQCSIENHPKLEGDVIVLSDNSGSAHGTFTSSYGSNTVAQIGNLSALITALSCTGRATIGLFGDKLLEYEVDKNRGFLEQFEELNKMAGERGKNVGGGTENGIWLFFKRAMENPEKYHYDHFFCYSDMQAGHGGLFGCDPEMDPQWLWGDNGFFGCQYIHVPKLLEDYRKKINDRISAFMVQTAGYDDSVLPQSTYRGAIMSGWTGNEVVYAKNILDIWDKRESESNSNAIKSRPRPKIATTTISYTRSNFIKKQKQKQKVRKVKKRKTSESDLIVELDEVIVKDRKGFHIKKEKQRAWIAKKNLEKKKKSREKQSYKKHHYDKYSNF